MTDRTQTLTRRAMLEAIDRARNGYGIMKTVSRAAGLRCIREFERINKIEFDPFNELHVSTVSGMAPFSLTFRKANNLQKVHFMG